MLSGVVRASCPVCGDVEGHSAGITIRRGVETMEHSFGLRCPICARWAGSSLTPTSVRLRCVGIGGAFNAETGGEGQLVAQCRELVVSDQTTIERAHVLDAQLAGPAKIDPARPPPIDVDPLEIRSGKA